MARLWCCSQPYSVMAATVKFLFQILLSKITFIKYISLRLLDGTQESHLVSEIKYLAFICKSWFYHNLFYIGHRKNVLMNFRKFISQEQLVSFSEALFVSIFTYFSNNK